MTLSVVPALLAACMAVGLGAFVWSRAPRRSANWAFAWGMTGLAMIELAQLAVLLDPGRRAVWLVVTHAAEAVMMPGWALFSVVFARSDPGAELRRWRWFLGAIGGLALLAPVLNTGCPISSSPYPVQAGLSDCRNISPVFALLAIVFVLFQLESTLRASRGVGRWRIKYLILGIFGIFSFRIFVLSDTLLDNALDLTYLPIQSTAMLVAMGLVGFHLARHRLLAVDIFVSRHVVYHSITVVAVGTYLLAMGIAVWLMQRFAITVDLFLVSLTVFVTAMAVVIGVLSESLRHRVRRTVATHFYRHKYDYRKEWTDVTRRLTSVVSSEAIPARIVAMVVEAIGIKKAAIFLTNGEHRFHVVHSEGVPEESLSIDADDPLVLGLAGQSKPADLSAVPDQRAGTAIARLRALGFTRLIALAANEEIIGLLAVGPPMGSAISLEDEELLATMAAQGATALLNARLAERLAQARELEAIHRVSAFMLHDLKNCVAMLSLVSQNATTMAGDPNFQRDAFRVVAESVRTMRELADRLAHLPREVEVRLAPMDLNGLVREAVDRTRVTLNGGIRVSTKLGPLPTILADEDQIRKILDNLLRNAVEALGGHGEVRVRTAAQDGSVSLVVSDNGPGIPEPILKAGIFTPFRTSKSQGLGIGLYHVKSIVTAHSGEIDVASEAGKGTSVEVRFPSRLETLVEKATAS